MTETSADNARSMTVPSGRPGRRILVCTPFAPRLDARHGGRPTAQLLRHLALRNDVAVLALQLDAHDHVDAALAQRCDVVREIARPRRGPLRRRVAWSKGLASGLPPWGVDCRSAAYAAALEELLEDWRPDVVEIHLQAMAQYVDVVEPRAIPRILVDYDPGSAWADEVGDATRGLRRLVRRAETAAWRRYERLTRPRFDAIVVFAERDLAAVSPTAGGTTVLRIPLSAEIPTQPFDAIGTPPTTVLFVGSFGHPPNVDAASWLARSLFPRVAERVPDTRLQLVGHAPGPEILALAGDRVEVHGSVPDVSPFYDAAAVVVAPIRIGGSMRGKVLEALAGGKAVVATSRGAEGVAATAGEQLLIADDERPFVDAVVSLLTDEARRRRLATAARAWAEAELGWGKGVAAFEALYERVAGE